VDGELLTKKRNPRPIEKQMILMEPPTIINESYQEVEIVKERKKKSYKLNKSKVRKKCIAFSRLEKSKKFLAFYSISFPQELPDEIAYKIFNTWLTRCRKECGLESYLWVAERQKNSTIHFHLLTNDFMPIKRVNSFMASCLASEKKKGLNALKSVETEKYNGVDVKKVDKDRKSLIGYLTKYITKNEIEFTHLPWHCSRDVSVLFTTINFDEAESDKYFNMIPKSPARYNVHKNENFNVGGFKFRPNEVIFSEMDEVNEMIYNPSKKCKANNED